MTKLPALTPIQIIRKLKKAGFVFDRQAKGSHEIWHNPKTHRRVILPNHPGKDVPQQLSEISLISQACLMMSLFGYNYWILRVFRT